MSSLVFKIGEESIPTVVDSKDYTHSPFFQPIRKGVDLICGFINANNEANCKPYDNPHRNNSDLKTQICNNIIAFLGERGSGKTSCMLSVVNVILDKRDKHNYPYRDSIEVFDVIDPSFFDSIHNITDIFIGEFYRKFTLLSKNFNKLPDDKRDELKKLQSEFKKVKSSFQYLNPIHKEAPLDDIDALSGLSSGVELSRSLSRLVNCYLKYIGKKTLLLVIDDLDLNIDSSYRMMEEIRKYLELPNVVILLGAKLDQLKLGVSSSFTKYKNEALLDESEIEGMAIRYLDKFIPATARVFMPDPANILNASLTVESPDCVPTTYQSVAFAIPSLIYQKTRFLFYNHDGTPSLITPRNLREIRMLISALTKMENPDDSDTSIHTANKEFFKKYFRNQWIPTLDREYQDFAIQLMEEPDIIKINKNTISFLSSASKSFRLWLDVSIDPSEDYSSSALLRMRLREINNNANANVNITVGDVMAMTSAIGEIENNHKVARLVFFIQTFYSMKLYELYDEMTAPENLDDSGIIEKVETPQTVPMLKNSKTVIMPDYQVLAAGDFFLLTGDSFIPFSRTRRSREIRLIDGDALNAAIRDIVSNLYDKEKKKFKDANPLQIATLRLIEFFVLCSRRALTSKKSEYSPTKEENWRQSIEPSYLTQLNSRKNIIFEATAPFFNLIFPKFAYQRYSPDLYELALAYKDSLLNSILDKRKRNKTRPKYADLMSRICLRNMEVLLDLNKWLTAKKDRLRPENEDGDSILIQFFRQFSPDKPHYSVKTYDLQADDISFHEIDFNPMANLADAIDFNSYKVSKGMTDTSLLKSLFEKIYSPTDEIQDNIHYTIQELSSKILEINSPDSTVLNKSVIEIFKSTRAKTLTAQKLITALLDYPAIENALLQNLFNQDLQKRYKDEYTNKSKRSVEDLDISIKELDKELKDIKKTEGSLKKKLTVSQTNLEKVKNKFTKLSTDRADKSQQALKLQIDKNLIMDEITTLTKQRDDVSAQIANSQPSVADSKTNIEYKNEETGRNLLHDLNDIDSKIQHKNTELLDLDSKINKIQDEITIIENDLDVCQGSLENARNEHDDLLRQLDVCRTQINDKTMRKDNLVIMKKKFEADLKELERKFKVSNR